jgi:polyisoprenoid-binding protein YceI
MSPKPGTYALGPENGTLSVRTGRRGAIAKVGHDLLIEVTSWGATLEIAPDAGQSRLELTADSNSLRVRQGTGGLQSLGEDERTGIDETIVAEVLKGTAISFRSREVTATSGSWRVEGDLELMGAVNPIAFELKLGGDGHVAGTAIVTQTAWGMKPYTTLFGTLKVADEVEVIVEGTIASV